MNASRIGCALIADGAPQRGGRPNPLVIARGQTLAGRAARAAVNSSCDEVAVVVGAHAGLVVSTLGEVTTTLISNPAWRSGLASSVRAAVAWSREQRHEALVILLCDQPWISAVHLDRLVTAYWHSDQAIASESFGALGLPALFPASWFPRLASLEGEHGPGFCLRAGREVVGIPWPEGIPDMDTQEELVAPGE
jgi:molybdenum cofactor cytidylyltransferase